jgi:hypothetical protein
VYWILFATFVVMMKQKLRKEYRLKCEAYDLQIARLRGYDRAFVIAEITTFVVGVSLLVVRASVFPHNWILMIALAVMIAYFYIRYLDTRNSHRIESLVSLRRASQDEINFLDGNFSAFDAGERYIDYKHPFSFDLDVFGRNGLFHRINRTVTTGGSDYLAECLASLHYRKGRSEAIDEIAEKPDFMLVFKSIGNGKQSDSDAVKASLGNIQRVTLPAFLRNHVFYAFCGVLFVGFWLSVFGAGTGLVSWDLPVSWGVFNLFFCLFVAKQALRDILSAVDSLHQHIHSYAQIISLIGNENFQAQENKSIREELRNAEASLSVLDDILQKLESRGNVMGLILLDSLCMWDIRIVYGFWKWRQKEGTHMEEWIAQCDRFDALVSMGTYRYNSPSAGHADVIDGSSVLYDARGLYHPFLDDKAVKNDFHIDDKNYYIITGANMAGKSTFLRSIGINYILAINGMPVFADSFEVSRFGLFTSMRTTDDLTQGVSYFNAELNRLQQLITLTTEADIPHLIILDEILKGTNSEDKLNGSRMFLEYISSKNVTGIIATHDLKLSEMADERPDRFHNYCFEIELGDSVTYSYKITKGVARNQNATFLLKQLIN